MSVQKLLLVGIIFLAATIHCCAQFSNMGFQSSTMGGNSFNNAESDDSSQVVKRFDIKKYMRALKHEDSMSIYWSFCGSIVAPGTAQIYNSDYWKLPIIYTGIGGMVAGGLINNSNFKKTGNDIFKTNSNLFYAGAALFYWASILDGVAGYNSKLAIDPGRATLYSLLLPGLGQIYNNDYWHIPIWYTALGVAGYCWDYNGKLYLRYKKLYNQATTPDGGYDGQTTVQNLKYYRDLYRRYRDYSILATVIIYALQAIDANVFATMSDFDISDDITVNVSPALISPIGSPIGGHNFASVGNTSYGLQFNMTF